MHRNKAHISINNFVVWILSILQVLLGLHIIFTNHLHSHKGINIVIFFHRGNKNRSKKEHGKHLIYAIDTYKISKNRKLSYMSNKPQPRMFRKKDSRRNFMVIKKDRQNKWKKIIKMKQSKLKTEDQNSHNFPN